MKVNREYEDGLSKGTVEIGRQQNKEYSEKESEIERLKKERFRRMKRSMSNQRGLHYFHA